VNVLGHPVPLGANELIDSLLQFRISDWGMYDAAVHSYIVRWMILPSIPAIIAMTAFIFSTFWSKAQSVKGLGIGVFILLSAFSLSLAYRISVTSPKVADIWYGNQYTSVRSNLKEWIEWFGVINKGDKHELDIVVDVDFDQVAWQVRDFTNVKFGSGTSEKLLPEIAITEVGDLALHEFGVYSMQTITISEEVNFDKNGYGNSLRWFFWDEDQSDITKINFWVRQDLFPSE